MKNQRSLVFILFLISTILISCDNNSTIYGPPGTHPYTPSDSSKLFYLADAVDLAVEHLYAIGSPDTTLVLVPDSVINLYLYPLARLYDSRTEFSILDTLISQRHVHKYLIWSVRTTVLVDTSETWVQNIRHNVTPTGNPTVDSLIELYNLEINTSSGWGFSGQDWVYISHPPLNSRALAQLFLPVSGVSNAAASFVSYTSSGIEIILYSNTTLVHLFYSSGSTGSHRWSFSIDREYNVDYLGYTP